MTDFVSFVAIMAALVLGLAILSIGFAVVLSIAIHAFKGNT
jgi:hypothetical protein